MTTNVDVKTGSVKTRIVELESVSITYTEK